MTSAPTPWTLADGRDLLFFSLPGHSSHPVPDRRPLPDQSVAQSELRFDRTTGQWVIIAASRQDRTYKPPPDQCPLCPGPSGTTSEIPAADYDVAVFENRFASLSGAGDAAFRLPPTGGDAFLSAPSHGRCEVICFSSDHTGSFAQLDFAQARLVVEAWVHRTAALTAMPGIAQVFCFENRGEEIGVTLTHPHGQIYGYPYLTPRTERMLREAHAHRARRVSRCNEDSQETAGYFSESSACRRSLLMFPAKVQFGDDEMIDRRCFGPCFASRRPALGPESMGVVNLRATASEPICQRGCREEFLAYGLLDDPLSCGKEFGHSGGQRLGKPITCPSHYDLHGVTGLGVCARCAVCVS